MAGGGREGVTTAEVPVVVLAGRVDVDEEEEVA